MKLFAAVLLALSLPAQAGILLTSSLTPTGNPNASGFAVVNLDGLVGDIQVSWSLSAPILHGSGLFDDTHTILLYPFTLPFNAGPIGFLQQTINFSPTDAATLLDGEIYVDIFSSNFPTDPGELGGELAVVPEPASIVLLGLGLAGVTCAAALRTRSRRRT